MNRKTVTVILLAVGFLTLALTNLQGSTPAASQVQQATANIEEQFIGGWRLVSLESPGPDGNLRNADSTGLLVFTRDGHMSVQVMERNAVPQTSAGPGQYSQGGYEASFGTYVVDPGTHTFTFHVEGALVRTIIGKDLPRYFELSGKQLLVKSTRPEEHWKVTWEHH